jgi:hypothetical protein
MDKNIWLRVIKQELGLLEQLAIGMIEDTNLSKAEVELAITRANIVAREFEMLLNSLSEPVAVSKAEETPKMASQTTVIEEKRVVPPVNHEKEIEMSVHEEKDSGREPVPHEGSVPPPIVRSPDPFPPHQEPHHTGTPFYRLEKEEHPALNLDARKEEYSHFKAAPLKSLKEGLILNDRYLFQRELFNNDKARLDETVAALDRLADIHEAVEYLKANFRWTKSEASEKFVQLVKRRFSN